MELKEGMHVRTKDGIILKINDIEDIYTTNNIFVGMCIYDNEGHFINDVEITKANYNPIDLIEVGDYVNGEKITRVIPQDICGDEVLDYQHIFVNDREIFEEDIKSIVTKEQFSQTKYRLGE